MKKGDQEREGNNGTMVGEYDPVQRHRLEMQGYTGYCDADLAGFGYWTRLAPGLCATVAAVGTATASEWVIWGLVPFALLGALMRIHPFDSFYNHVLRRMFNTPALPHHGRPRRFACSIATLWLAGTGWAFYAGADPTGYLLGILFVITASVPTFIGFCVPSWVYRGVQKVRRDRG